MCKRLLQNSGASVKKRQRTSSQSVTDIGDLVFLFFTAASCAGLCQGCDLCHPEVCAPKEANAIEKDGIIYKQIGRDFKRAFASLTCLFIRMRASFKGYWTPTVRLNHRGRSNVTITDDYGNRLETQALKFACLAWGQVTPAAMLGTAGMPLRDFKHDFSVDHIDGNPSNNNVSNGLIMTEAEHKEKTRLSEAQRAKQAMSKSAPCTMTIFDLEGNPKGDSEGKPIVENEPHRKKVMDDYKLKTYQITNSIAYEDIPTRNSLVKIKYKGQDCLAQFSWYNLPDLEGEIWKPVTETDHKTLKLPIPPLTEYYVSNLARFKTVTKSTQNAKITNYQGKNRPLINKMKKHLYFHRIVALVFHRKKMKKADHDTLKVPLSEVYEYYVSNMARFKTVTKSTQNAKITNYQGQKRPRLILMKKALYFYRIVALVFHREQMNEYIAEQKAKTGIVWTFATLDVDHIDFKSTNHRANNLQFLIPQENIERSNNRPCIIWEKNSNTKKEYPSVTAAANAMGYKSTQTVHNILKNNKHKKWRGEYIVK